MRIKVKRWAGIALATVLAASTPLLGACSQEGSQVQGATAFGKTEASVERKTYPYVKGFVTQEDGSSDYDRGEIALYYVEGGDIPYVATTEYMNLLSEALDKRGRRPGIAYTTSKLEGNIYKVKRTDVDSSMLIDTKENTITFDNLNSFTQLASVTASVTLIDLPEPPAANEAEASQDGGDASSEASSTAETSGSESLEASSAALSEESATSADATSADEASGSESSDASSTTSSDASSTDASETKQEEQATSEMPFATAGESVNLKPHMVTLELSDYLIDIVEHDGECYVPLQTMNDLFMGPLYLQYVFNGEGLYAMKYGEKRIDEAYEVEPREMSEDYALFNYNELRLLLDVHYGLKPEHGIDNFGQLLGEKTSLAADFASTDPTKTDEALKKLTITYLDDQHSAFQRTSPWSPSGGAEIGRDTYAENYSYSTNKHILFNLAYNAAREKAFPEGVPMYQEIGDTAFVTFDEFVSVDDPADYYHMDELNPDEFIIPIQDANSADAEAPTVDTIQLLAYAHRQITREGSPIKNVVVDLSMNVGGSADAAVFAISWALGEANVAVRDTFTGAQTFMRINADFKLDKTYGLSASLASNFLNIYCLTSPNSFSCGNLVPAALKMSGRATIVGQTSGGGSCTVLPCTTASGAAFAISSSYQLSTVSNGSFYNIDQGIEPDVVLTKTASFYDREALAEYLKSLK